MWDLGVRKGHNVKGGGTPGDVEGRGRQEMVIKWKAGGDDRSYLTPAVQLKILNDNVPEQSILIQNEALVTCSVVQWDPTVFLRCLL